LIDLRAIAVRLHSVTAIHPHNRALAIFQAIVYVCNIIYCLAVSYQVTDLEYTSHSRVLRSHHYPYLWAYLSYMHAPNDYVIVCLMLCSALDRV